MYLEHLNLVVTDLDKSIAFYQAAFPDWRVRGGRKDDWYGKPREWLHFGDDRLYLALSDHGEGKIRAHKGHQVGVSHFAFVVNNLPSLRARMEAAGYEVTNPGNHTEYRRNIYFNDPDGFEVEFVEYLSDINAERNKYD